MIAKRGSLSLLLFLLAACAPVIPQEVLRNVDKDLPFQIVLCKPNNFKGDRGDFTCHRR